MNKTKKSTDFQKYLKHQLKNKDLKRYYDEYGKQLEIAYQIILLRKKYPLLNRSWQNVSVPLKVM